MENEYLQHQDPAYTDQIGRGLKGPFGGLGGFPFGGFGGPFGGFSGFLVWQKVLPSEKPPILLVSNSSAP
ncbi:hypothetical protein JQC72_05135 [Polycladomyces sp. WAk]|uniref:Uncharacterized protein n=1 Tax=Polycladomyces zharkentensis TaxID=2807616 RepID=A0ABS2WH74_9BACL|nr:hypothetical protein [Polycladomyces sp. WAk]MBN2908908.1 hypothetical protein [Polycladomyces sp. WAk]